MSDLRRCVKCGKKVEWVTMDDMWCPECQQKLIDRFLEATKEFSKEERDVIFDFMPRLEWVYMAKEEK